MTHVFCISRMRPLDIAFMKAVHHKVNIVPVIAKADTLTKKEVLNLKRKVRSYERKKLHKMRRECFVNLVNTHNTHIVIYRESRTSHHKRMADSDLSWSNHKPVFLRMPHHLLGLVVLIILLGFML